MPRLTLGTDWSQAIFGETVTIQRGLKTNIFYTIPLKFTKVCLNHRIASDKQHCVLRAGGHERRVRGVIPHTAAIVKGKKRAKLHWLERGFCNVQGWKERTMDKVVF